jgi:hypothetical protein
MPGKRTLRPTTPLFRPWFIATVACLIYCLAVIGAEDGDPLALVTIGTRFSQGIPEEYGGTEGYDGQFVYYIARDPSTAEHFLDAPGYRFQRILLPALAMILSFGQDDWIPWALMVINLVAVGAGTALLERLLAAHGVSRWYALGYGFALGIFGAARLSLPEPLAYALVLGAIVVIREDRWLPGAALLALAALTKETSLIFVAGYGLYLLVNRRLRDAILFGAVAGIPFILWQGVLLAKLGEIGVGSGGAMATGFEAIPFGGVLRILYDGVPDPEFQTIPFGSSLIVPAHDMFTPGVLALFGIFLLLLTPFVLYPTVWALRKCWLAYREGAITPIACLLFANAAIMLFVPFSTYREPLGILRFVVGLQIAVVLFAAERRSARALLNSTIWGYTFVLILAWDFLPAE